MLDLSSIPLIDNHCHSLLRNQPQSVLEWRACFTESYFSEIPREHVPHTIFYQWALRELGALYECDADENAVLEKCNALDLKTRVQHINRAANIEAWLVDYGYSTTHTFAHEELQNLAGIRVEKILRVEPLIEQLVLQVATFDQLHDAFVNELQNLRAQKYAALKSILAYRVGLNLSPATRDDARAAFPALKERATRDGTLRVDSKPFLDYMISRAVEIAAQQEFPIQFHTGFGDPDQDLLTSNPALLRPLFAEKYRGAKIILLHAGYPYTRSLGYLASVYPNVYADFGLAIPFVTSEARTILRELLGLAPASKILYSSDAFHIPELYYLGAVLGRRALGDVLEQFVREDLITATVAETFGEMILRGNARRLYESE
jgi:hypothetical protein